MRHISQGALLRRFTILGSAAGFTARRNSTATTCGAMKCISSCGRAGRGAVRGREIPVEALRAASSPPTSITRLPMLAGGSSQRAQSLSLFLPAEAVSGFREFLELCFLYSDLLGFERELRPVAPGKVYDRDGLIVEAFSNRHLVGQAERLRREGRGRTGQSFSYLATVNGKRIAFSGDMAKASEVTELAKRADLAVVEMAHFTPEELGEALAVTELPRVVLTHIIHPLEPEEKTLPARLRPPLGKAIVARGTEVEV
jgi:hypothetical protein